MWTYLGEILTMEVDSREAFDIEYLWGDLEAESADSSYELIFIRGHWIQLVNFRDILWMDSCWKSKTKIIMFNFGSDPISAFRFKVLLCCVFHHLSANRLALFCSL